MSPDASPDINYVTVCTLDEGGFGDGTQEFTHAYVAHVSQALELDPAFAYSYVRSDQGTWTYDDGEVRQEREYTDVGGGMFHGVRGLVGTGWHARLQQRDQTSSEDGDGACAGVTGRSTCWGSSAWFTVQDVGGVGVGFYYQQSGGSGADCVESFELDLSLGIVFVPVTGGPGSPCTADAPYLYDEVPFRDLPLMP